MADGDRRKIRVREIAVVAGELLRPHGPGFSADAVVKPGFLKHLAAGFINVHLPLRLVGDGAHTEFNRIEVLDLRPDAQIFQRFADGNVRVAAHGTLFHVPIAGAEITENGAKFTQVGSCLFGASEIGFGDDFHQTNAGAVQIDQGLPGIPVVHGLARVLFQVQTFDPHFPDAPVLHIQDDGPLADDGALELTDLIALGQIGVEIVLAFRNGGRVDPGLQAQSGTNRLFDAILVHHGKHSRHGGVHEGDLRVRFRPEVGRRAGKELGLGNNLAVDLQPDHHFPIARFALDRIGHRPGIPAIFGATSKPAARSKASAALKSVSSSKGLPISCKPNGKPSAPRPTGREMAGSRPWRRAR